MAQEDKQLLLKDLCARLPYGVKVKSKNGEVATLVNPPTAIQDDCWNFKPYLRPMSSMTGEEHGRYMEFIEWSHNDYDGTTTTCISKERLHEYLDFIYSHHLDDNNFIERGLALEAPEGMYKTE